MKYLGENFVVKIKTWLLNKLSDKANASDVLLKKSASGGYYIEENSHELGLLSFAVNSYCTASGMLAYAEGIATASGSGAHAEGSATASGETSHAEGTATASGETSHAEGTATASGGYSHAEGSFAKAIGEASHAEGNSTEASGIYSHAEGVITLASGYCAHALGTYNVDDKNAIHSVGIGNNATRKNAEYIYAKNNKSGFDLTDDPKNGYKYLIGVGGYDGISTDNSKYKSVQEVIAELTAEMRKLLLPVTAVSGDAVAMDANKAYEITVGETLTLTLTSAEDTTIVNLWQGTFDTGSTAPTVTWPADVIWADTPTVKANTHYEFNIRYTDGKYYGLVLTWEINTERSIYEN